MNNICAISDPEGYDIMNLCNNMQNCDKLYICGDILDSTFMGKDFNDKYKLTKSYNLSNIRNCIINNKIKLAFGNRDLNKLKCKHLCKLNGNTEHINKYNNGNIDLNVDTYKKILEEIKNLDSSNRWNAKMKNWYSFWFTTNPNFKKQKENFTDNYPDNTIFKKRFDDIFGPDPVTGTMSAPNLLHCIPIELKITDEINKLTSDEEKNDFKAFIVLSIFRSMNLNFDTHIENIEKIENIKNSINVKGWLTQLYTLHQACYYLEMNDNIYLFSHGGISKTLINNPEILQNIYNKCNSTTKLYEYLTNLDKLKIGGYYNTINNNIKKNINKINEIIKNVISSLDQSDLIIPDQNVLFLIMITTGFNCEDFVKIIDNPQYGLCNNTYPIGNLGPIMPGIETMRNLMFTVPNKKLYQIIGHKPIGVASTIDLFKNNQDCSESFLINLDISNTFTGQNYNILENDNNISFTRLEIANNDVNFITKINIDTKEPNFIKKTYNTDIINKNKNIDLENILYYSSDLVIPDIMKININNKIDTNTINNIKKTATTNKNLSVCYNGTAMINNKKYYILVHQKDKSFNKNILILNEKDFNDFCENETDLEEFNELCKNKTDIYDYNNYYEKYYEKYVKYKDKYRKLKSELEKYNRLIIL